MTSNKFYLDPSQSIRSVVWIPLGLSPTTKPHKWSLRALEADSKWSDTTSCRTKQKRFSACYKLSSDVIKLSSDVIKRYSKWSETTSCRTKQERFWTCYITRKDMNPLHNKKGFEPVTKQERFWTCYITRQILNLLQNKKGFQNVT